jgi:hypothetical protein
MKSFLAEARRKQKQEAAGNFRWMISYRLLPKDRGVGNNRKAVYG